MSLSRVDPANPNSFILTLLKTTSMVLDFASDAEFDNLISDLKTSLMSNDVTWRPLHDGWLTTPPAIAPPRPSRFGLTAQLSNQGKVSFCLTPIQIPITPTLASPI